MNFAVGQRWLSHADTELGLGVVVAVQARRVSLHFPAVEEDRTYAVENAPLTRLSLKPGDRLRTVEGLEAEVIAVEEAQRLLIYRALVDGAELRVPEMELAPQIELDTPLQRLMTGQLDNHAAFALRVATCQHRHRIEGSGLRGMLGTRTALLPHQLFIADEVGRRHAPRVLLADEVGLGKTIEAGMILHRQLLSGAARRVLILVPDSLQYQWLVEMRRRFNLAFALFDETRLAQPDMDNPFESEQLVLCAWSLFHDQPLYRELTLLAPWDLVVIDEAHRVHWDSEDESDEFRFLRELAAATAGLLLLTATPEQLGQDSHFARLSLLDPARFHDLERFREEERAYRQWSTLVDAIDRGERPPGLPADIDPNLPGETQIARLIDRYGTGRVLFRNARAAIGGFPERVIERYPLRWPAAPRDALYPEQSLPAEVWLTEDPRVLWLTELLRRLRPEKVLVICADAATAEALESQLQLRAGVRAAAFHEGLSLVERDRAAAWFADRDQGAQALLCSEIGSEGRNFQFAQHLVLYDLPRHPDQLEQRIGRLDRIGQRERIFIHLPYLAGTAQEVLLRWYDEGINLLRESCSAGDMILERFAAPLAAALAGDAGIDLDALISDTAAFTALTREELAEGRDRLLERSSCDPIRGASLARDIASLEDPVQIDSYLDELCAVIGVEQEHHSEHCSILRPGEQERLPLFPDIGEDGCTVTVCRDTALAREDMQFLSWEHPWLDDAMEMLLESHVGQAAVGTLTLKGVPAGSRLYEFIFTLSLSAPRELQLYRYLPLSPLRLLVDAQGRDLDRLLSHERLNGLLKNLPRSSAGKIVKRLQDEIESRVRAAEEQARAHCDACCSQARALLEQHLGAEIERLKTLQRVNPAVRDDEITSLQQQRERAVLALGTATPVLQGLRLVVTQ